MTDERLSAIRQPAVKDCENYRDELAGRPHQRRWSIYDGTNEDVPADANRSKVVSARTVPPLRSRRCCPRLIAPSSATTRWVEYAGRRRRRGGGRSGERLHQLCRLSRKQCYDAVQDAAHDALKLRNGVDPLVYEKQTSIAISAHTGRTKRRSSSSSATTRWMCWNSRKRSKGSKRRRGRWSSRAYTRQDPTPHQRGTPRLAAVPLEEFLSIGTPSRSRTARSPASSSGCGASDLIAMGYDRGLIEGLPALERRKRTDDEVFARRREPSSRGCRAEGAGGGGLLRLYVKWTRDDDGIAELRRSSLPEAPAKSTCSRTTNGTRCPSPI
ncbi:hypothetical protein F2981_16510 [Sinorhizobium meliloti]|nr:hypothetical protein [Sinorhizobium meliloti]